MRAEEEKERQRIKAAKLALKEQRRREFLEKQAKSKPQPPAKTEDAGEFQYGNFAPKRSDIRCLLYIPIYSHFSPTQH